MLETKKKQNRASMHKCRIVIAKSLCCFHHVGYINYVKRRKDNWVREQYIQRTLQKCCKNNRTVYSSQVAKKSRIPYD